MKRLAFVIIGAVALSGCGPAEPKSMKSEYAFEVVGYEIGSGMDIVRVINMTTGKSRNVMRNGSNGLILLPEGF